MRASEEPVPRPRPASITMGGVGKGIWNFPVIIIFVLVAIVPLSLIGWLFLPRLLEAVATGDVEWLGGFATAIALSTFLLVRMAKKKRL